VQVTPGQQQKGFLSPRARSSRALTNPSKGPVFGPIFFLELFSDFSGFAPEFGFSPDICPNIVSWIKLNAESSLGATEFEPRRLGRFFGRKKRTTCKMRFSNRRFELSIFEM
jgi:hypothetical protein